MIVPMELRHALHVCLRMRESDRAIISQTRFGFDFEAFALERFNTEGLKVAAIAQDGRPVGIGGLSVKSPGVWLAWIVGTDRWHEAAFEVVWFSRKTVRRLLATGAGHRVEAYCAAEDENARRYLELVGMKREGTLAAARANREDLCMYAIVSKNGQR